MQLIIEYSIISFFLFWSVLCVIVQIPKMQSRIRKYDFLSMIPDWRFFAPKPGEHDFFLLYRDVDKNDHQTAWVDTKLFKNRHWWNAIWNPYKRENKALFDLVVELSQLIVQKEEAIELSIPYISLLLKVSKETRRNQPKLTQFMLMIRKTTATESEVLYISKLHQLS